MVEFAGVRPNLVIIKGRFNAHIFELALQKGDKFTGERAVNCNGGVPFLS